MLSTYEPWEDYELTFLCETYPSKDWSVLQIAQKLDRSINGIHQKAFALGIKRPNRTFTHRDTPAFIEDLRGQHPIKMLIKKWGCTKTEIDRGRARLKAEMREAA
jgi:hypothetical protein